MTVYVLNGLTSYEPSKTIGVFSSWDLAAKHWQKDLDLPKEERKYQYHDSCEIKEFTIDQTCQ